MAPGTQPGAPTGGALTHLTTGRHLVKVLPTAPYTKQGESVDTKVTKVMGNESLQIVFGNKDGAIDTSIPTSPPNGTGWTQENIDAQFNQLAETTGVVPEATKTGIPPAKYKTWGGFLQDIVNRGSPVWIVVKDDPKNPKYSRFSYIEGPGDAEEYQGADGEEEPF